MKQAALHVMRASGVFAACRCLHRRRILILTYHRFDASPSRTALSARAFGEQLAYLRAHYTIVPLSAVERHLTAGAALPRSAAAITIDDGYADAYEVAFPILQRHRAPATLFAAVDFIDRRSWLWTDKMRVLLERTGARRMSVEIGGVRIEAPLAGDASRFDAAARANEALKLLPDDLKERTLAEIGERLGVTLPPSPPAGCSAATWSQVREMAAAGIEIGSHTVTHPILTRLPRERVARELRESRRRLEQILDREVTTFCYPNGDYDAGVRDEAAQAGYRLAVTTEAGLNDASIDPLALRRIHTDHDFAHFVQSTSGFEAVKSRLRAGAAGRLPRRRRPRPDVVAMGTEQQLVARVVDRTGAKHAR